MLRYYATYKFTNLNKILGSLITRVPLEQKLASCKQIFCSFVACIICLVNNVQCSTNLVTYLKLLLIELLKSKSYVLSFMIPKFSISTNEIVKQWDIWGKKCNFLTIKIFLHKV